MKGMEFKARLFAESSMLSAVATSLEDPTYGSRRLTDDESKHLARARSLVDKIQVGDEGKVNGSEYPLDLAGEFLEVATAYVERLAGTAIESFEHNSFDLKVPDGLTFEGAYPDFERVLGWENITPNGYAGNLPYHGQKELCAAVFKEMSKHALRRCKEIPDEV
jgi:hypothetical protein